MHPLIRPAPLLLVLASCLPWSMPELEPAADRAGGAGRPPDILRPDTSAAMAEATPIQQAAWAPPLSPAVAMPASALWLFPEPLPSARRPDDIARRLAVEGSDPTISRVAEEVGIERGNDLPGVPLPNRIALRNPLIIEDPGTGSPILVIPRQGSLGPLIISLDRTLP